MTDQAEIIKLYRLENEAMVNKDLLTLNDILTTDMTLTHMTGYVQPKLEWIDQIQNGDMRCLSSIEEQISAININQDEASLIGHNCMKAAVWGGSVNTWPLAMKMYFVKTAGHWRISRQVASTY
jgi:hypothetical protein